MGADRKSRISAAFGAASGSYDDAAAPQRLAAALLADLARQRRPAADARILELGCGTGILTRLIRARWPHAALIASDLSPEMVKKAAALPHVAGTFLTMDGEAPAFEGPWFDLILSNLAFQWFDDQARAVERIVGLLRPGGSLIFSTMGARSFAAWRAAHERCGLQAGIAAYPALEDLRAMLGRHADAFVFDEDYPLEGVGARALLTHLKGIGATVPLPGHPPLRPGELRRVMASFDDAGGRDAYHVLFARVTRLHEHQA